MKKNIAMRVAAFLFILTMISTCAFATTFAKYTTSGNATDTARVAKFGVEVSGKVAADNNLFTKTYKNGENVIVESTVDVVAPGTSGTFSEFEITGTPEVDVEVIYAVTVDLEGWTVGEEYYFPIVVKVNDTAVTLTVTASESAWEEAIKEAIEKTLTFDAGTDLSTKKSDTNLTVTWEWAFEGNNTNDTALGDAAANGNPSKITINITCTVNQIN